MVQVRYECSASLNHLIESFVASPAVSETAYGYVPHEGVAIVFLILFGTSTCMMILIQIILY
jgi:hypothetical protein